MPRGPAAARGVINATAIAARLGVAGEATVESPLVGHAPGHRPDFDVQWASVNVLWLVGGVTLFLVYFGEPLARWWLPAPSDEVRLDALLAPYAPWLAGFYAVAALVLLWLNRHRRRAPELPAGTIQADIECLHLRRGEWEIGLPWAAVTEAESLSAGFRLVLGGHECLLPHCRSAQRIYAAARLVVDRRRQAGRNGLQFTDEVNDASLSPARMTGEDLSVERGLSQAEE